MYSQKKMFDEVIHENGRDFVVFYLDISEEEANNRLTHRKICSSCGTTYSTILNPGITHCTEDGTELSTRVDDQSAEAIAERFALFHKETKPILDEYVAAGKVVLIDGTKSIEDITKEIIAHI
jgi:adenylate kinase